MDEPWKHYMQLASKEDHIFDNESPSNSTTGMLKIINIAQ